jgi:hypothetical protein
MKMLQCWLEDGGMDMSQGSQLVSGDQKRQGKELHRNAGLMTA